jgi:hypothetical protein
MQINCLHGYFIFRENRAGEISDFMSLFSGLELVAKDDYFTFAALASSPDYSVEGATYLGATAIKTFEGKPWEVLKQNRLVYNFNSGAIIGIDTVTQRVEIASAANYFLSPGLILPGSVRTDGSRVTDYAAWYLFDSNKFKYSEVTYE